MTRSQGTEASPAGGAAFKSILDLEARGVTLEDALSISISLGDLARHLSCSPEKVVRDGLGPFGVIVMFSKTIGFWAFAGSEAHPNVGASIWAYPKIDAADLTQEIRQVIGALPFDTINSITGEIIDHPD